MNIFILVLLTAITVVSIASVIVCAYLGCRQIARQFSFDKTNVLAEFSSHRARYIVFFVLILALLVFGAVALIVTGQLPFAENQDISEWLVLLTLISVLVAGVVLLALMSILFFSKSAVFDSGINAGLNKLNWNDVQESFGGNTGKIIVLTKDKVTYSKPSYNSTPTLEVIKNNKPTQLVIVDKRHSESQFFN